MSIKERERIEKYRMIRISRVPSPSFSREGIVKIIKRIKIKFFSRVRNICSRSKANLTRNSRMETRLVSRLVTLAADNSRAT